MKERVKEPGADKEMERPEETQRLGKKLIINISEFNYLV